MGRQVWGVWARTSGIPGYGWGREGALLGGHPVALGVPHPVEKGHWRKVRAGSPLASLREEKAANTGPSAREPLRDGGFSYCLNTR